jgi:hypothetical protein
MVERPEPESTSGETRMYFDNLTLAGMSVVAVLAAFLLTIISKERGDEAR